MKYKCICVLLCSFIAVGNTQVFRPEFFPKAKCPQGEHLVLFCSRQAEPDCDIPDFHDASRPQACDKSKCLCNAPTVRNLATGLCVHPDDCPKKELDYLNL
ncbi:uncharacterized protein LOC125236809 [Leguminivora glycinivorella]|uniref:uncharacterized protein LOC125236809 n=1 Tax=Leguminivora glycinivorella TaxID=1035111 RepID=UPI00200F8512|nr:uncharacterized protein LOC125236809 [Leguminivora glycinivorella]